MEDLALGHCCCGGSLCSWQLFVRPFRLADFVSGGFRRLAFSRLWLFSFVVGAERLCISPHEDFAGDLCCWAGGVTCFDDFMWPQVICELLPDDA